MNKDQFVEYLHEKEDLSEDALILVGNIFEFICGMAESQEEGCEILSYMLKGVVVIDQDELNKLGVIF